MKSKLEDTPNQVKIDTIKSELAALDQALKEKTNSEVASPSSEATSGQTSAVPGYSGIHKEMSTDYASQMQNHKPIVDSFEIMKEYLKHHHSSKMSAYQYLDTCWELEEQESETLRDYARRISDKMCEARGVIEAKFETYKKASDNSIEKVTMSTKEVFDMVSGQIFLQRLKMKRPKVFNQIVSDLDEVWNASTGILNVKKRNWKFPN